MNRNRRSPALRLAGRLLSIAGLAGLLAQGCGDDDEKISGGAGQDIRILSPQQGEVVRTHSVRFALSLSSEIDPAGLQVLLNGRDAAPHLRVSGTQAEGAVQGMAQGQNVLRFVAAGHQGAAASAEVRLTFAPVEVDAVEAAETLKIPGVQGVVDVLVDPWGVHHIYTMEDNPEDLLRIQGYLMARHRLFQIDFFRKVAQGRLAELLGTALNRSVLETDLFFRTAFLTREGGQVGHVDEVMTEAIARDAPEVFASLVVFVEGINAYIEDLREGRNGAALSQQHQLLNLLGPYEIEPMTVEQIVAIGRLQQYELSSTLHEEIRRKLQWDWVVQAEQAGTLPAGTLADVFRAKPPDPATILAPGESGYLGPASFKQAAASERTAAATPFAPGEEAPGRTEPERNRHLSQTLLRLERVRETIWQTTDRPFSNNWILAPEMTASGVAMLCNDPHLSLSNPSIFYPTHCDNKSFSGGDLNFTGCTFPGIPGLMLGVNERLAWGGTVVGYDVEDVYEETVQTGADGTDQVFFQGQMVPVETVLEVFAIRGDDPIEIPIDYVPHHGPQVPGDPYSDDPTLAAENNLSFRWSGHFITQDLEAFFGLLRAQNIDEFHAALEKFGVGAQNWVGADVAGEIAYFPHALIPLRAAAALTPEHPPYLPLPGTGEYEWLQDSAGRPVFLSADEVPQVRNPERGWLASANNDITGTAQDNDVLNDGLYLYYSTSVGFRGGRIGERLLELGREERNLDEMKNIQGDHLSRLAARIRPFLLEALSDPAATEALAPEVRSRLEEAQARLQAWDLRCKAGTPDAFTGEQPSQADIDSSVGASLFFVWLNRLTEGVFNDEFAGSPQGLGSDDRAVALLHILEDAAAPAGSVSEVHTLGPDGQSLLWDDRTTAERQERRDEIMVRAMARALTDLEDLMGSRDMGTWRWGNIHTLTLRLEGLGSVLLAFNLPSYSIGRQVLAGILGMDLKGYPRNGGWQTVDPAHHSLHGLDFSAGSGPAMRMVVELEEGVMTAYNVLPGGVNDLDPARSIAVPVQVNPEIHYGDQVPLWLANRYRPQLLFWEDVTNVAESRLRFEPL
ncbi:MAG: penicillin acylase family protein [bacterium]